MIDAGLFIGAFVAAATTLFALVPSYSDASTIKRWDCPGYAVNGYGSKSPRYKKFYAINHVVATICPADYLRNKKPCKFYLDNKSYKSYYLDGGSELLISDDAFGDNFDGNFTPATGHLYYLISYGPDGTNQNETQRWYEGFCIER